MQSPEVTNILLTVPRFNTASGKYYCNKSYILYILYIALIVSIPQAVSTIAIEEVSNSNDHGSSNVSIPQAVSTIAIVATLNGEFQRPKVSIPQAVSTIAI